MKKDHRFRFSILAADAVTGALAWLFGLLGGGAAVAAPVFATFCSCRAFGTMADGLTVPFALAAGISGAITAAHIVVTAGVAEIAAGSIAMGLGGYLAARSESEHYQSEKRREEQEIVDMPEEEAREVAEVFMGYGLNAEESAKVVASLRLRPDAWRDFMMRFELGLEEPDPTRALKSAATIAGSTAGLRVRPR